MGGRHLQGRVETSKVWLWLLLAELRLAKYGTREGSDLESDRGLSELSLNPGWDSTGRTNCTVTAAAVVFPAYTSTAVAHRYSGGCNSSQPFLANTVTVVA